MRSKLRFVVALFASLALVSAVQPLRADESPVIAAASDLQFALTEVAGRFEEDTGVALRLAFGSSGNFARQIRQGAPFALYLSADEDFVLGLAEDGLTRDEGVLYAVGRIVLVVAHGSPLEPDGSLENLREALEARSVSRFAIANPEHAPYGRAAREALVSRGLWQDVEAHLVIGENVSQAAQFAITGNAEGGIVAYSLMLGEGVAGRSEFDLIPEEWHAPLRQRMALLQHAGPVAEAFYDYLQSDEARGVLERYGFALPGEDD